MAAKRVDPAAAKAAKQKKIAIVGAVLLVVVLAIQGPKTLKMLKGPQREATPTANVGPGGPAVPETGGPAAPAAGGPAAPATGAPATPGGTPAGATPPVATAELAAVPDSDQAPVVDAGQLATFERFSSKDPFAQQAVTPKPAQPPAKSAPGKSADPEEGSDPAKAADPTKGGTVDGDTDGGFTTGGTKPPAATELASATTIAVNGVAEDVKLETPFPAAEPTFVLVSIAANGKSVEIGIAGGEYANGGETLELALGKKVTLQNTADGSRYELELRSIQGFPLPEQKG